MFYMGTDFRKLKAPAMWYDIVSVTDLLSKHDFVKTDSRFCEMVELIKGKQDADGMFIPESVFQKFKGWDFGHVAICPMLPEQEKCLISQEEFGEKLKSARVIVRTAEFGSCCNIIKASR